MPLRQKARYEGMLHAADKVAVERTVQIFLNHDFTEELEELGKRLKVPVLILHRSDDHANPVETHASLVQSLLPESVLKGYEGAGHSLYQMLKDRCMAAILTFLSKI